MNKRAITLATLIGAGLTLTACAGTGPLETGTAQCQDSLPGEIRHANDDWADAKVETHVTDQKSRDGSDYAYDVYGTADIELSDGTTTTVTWECFTQTANGETHAAIISIDED